MRRLQVPTALTDTSPYNVFRPREKIQRRARCESRNLGGLPGPCGEAPLLFRVPQYARVQACVISGPALCAQWSLRRGE